MGQYYNIINVDKKEIISTWDLDCGIKLMEFAYNKTEATLALTNKLAGDWKGDRVYVVGDYAEPDDPKEVWYRPLKKAMEELGATGSIYEYASKNFRNITKECDIEDNGYRYIVNKSKKQYIDLTHCPIEWAWYDIRADKVSVSSDSPLVLLLAMGNDRGGGDFREGHHGYEYVGTWCGSVRNIQVLKDYTPGKGYTEFCPNFSENDRLIPYTEAKYQMKKAKVDVLQRELNMALAS